MTGCHLSSDKTEGMCPYLNLQSIVSQSDYLPDNRLKLQVKHAEKCPSGRVETKLNPK